MKRSITIHYTLFLAIILGAFASMAQNDYGLLIVAISCFLFAFLILVDLIKKISKSSWDKVIELIGLSTLFTLFGFRALYIHFSYVELILVVAAFLLLIVYSLHLVRKRRSISKENQKLGLMITLYYLSLIGFNLSLVAAMITPVLSEISGIISMLLLSGMIVLMVLNRIIILDGEEVKSANYLRRHISHSSILITGFFLMSIYAGLYMIRAVPPLYTSKLPHSYIELINAAESGEEVAEDGVYKYQRYEEAYIKFVKKLENED